METTEMYRTHSLYLEGKSDKRVNRLLKKGGGVQQMNSKYVDCQEARNLRAKKTPGFSGNSVSSLS